jgi:hypothetical protein
VPVKTVWPTGTPQPSISFEASDRSCAVATMTPALRNRVCSRIVPGVVPYGSFIKAVRMGTEHLDHERSRNDRHCQNRDYDDRPFHLSLFTS